MKRVDADSARSAEQTAQQLAKLGRTQRSASTMRFVRKLYKELGDSEALSRLDAENDR